MQTDDNQAPNHPEHRYHFGSALLLPLSVTQVELAGHVVTYGCHIAHGFEEASLHMSSIPPPPLKTIQKIRLQVRGRGLKIWAAALKPIEKDSALGS